MKNIFLIISIFFITIFVSCKNENNAESSLKTFLQAIYIDNDWQLAESVTTKESASVVEDFKYFSAFNQVANEDEFLPPEMQFSITQNGASPNNDSAFFIVNFSDSSSLEFLVVLQNNFWLIDLLFDEQGSKEMELNEINEALKVIDNKVDMIQVENDSVN